MDEPRKRSSLGRGLSALFGEAAAEETDSSAERAERVRLTRLVPIELIQPGRYQPRRKFDPEAIRSLVESVKEKGILQPILVRKLDGDANHYEIIAGERRWRAAQLAGLHEVPVLVRQLTDRDALEVALIENVQRQDLTPLEEAEGYQRLVDEFGHTQEDLAKAVGRSRPHVANMLRLLGLPEEVKSLVQDGSLSMGHARALLTADHPGDLARVIVDKGLSVRQTEALAKAPAKSNGAAAKLKPAKSPDTMVLERELSAVLGLKVTLSSDGRAGTLAIHYQSLDQLDIVLARILGKR